jgi:sugar lactone lactonase YvrE
MKRVSLGSRAAMLALVNLAWWALPAAAQDRSEITIEDASAAPENLTSTQDGTVFFGSTTKGTIYRALPDKSQAVAWIQGDKAKLTTVLGLLADEKSNTLWVCDNARFGRGTPPAGLPALRSFDLTTGEAKGTYGAPGGGVCNDVAIAADGTAYTSDTFGGRVLRLKPGGKELEVWASGPELRGVDGLSFLADGSLYVNLIFNGKLLRIPVKEDGTAGPVVEIKTSAPFSRPDGLRTSGPKSLLQAEGGGRLTEITVNGDKAEVRVLKDGLSGSLGVTQFGTTAFVLADRKKAVAVPMTVGSQGEAPKKP